MHRMLPALLSLLTFASCVTYAVDEIRPDYDGTVIFRTRGNTLLDRGNIALNVQAMTDSNGRTSYDLVFAYWSDYSWLFVESGASLVMSIDGERVAFKSARGSTGHREASGGSVYERAWYPTTPERLRQIAQASEVKFKVQGSKGFLESTFSKGNFDHFRQFVADYVNVEVGGALGAPADEG